MTDLVPSAHAARLWQSGFELNSTTAVEWETGSGPSIQSTTVRSGTYALQFNSLSSGIRKFLSNSYTGLASGPFYHRVYFRVGTLPSAENRIISVNGSVSGGTSERVYITLDNTGALRLYDEDGVIGSASSPLSTDTWYRIEILTDRSPSAGSHEIRARIDGTEFAGSATRDISAGFLALHIGGNLNKEAQTTGNWYFDDVAINSSTGSFQTSYPGQGSIVHLRPNATGDNSAWTGDNTDIDEVTPDDATTTISSSTLNQTEDVNLDDTSASVGSNATINVVSVGVRANSDATTANARFVLRIKASSGGTTEETSNINNNTTTWYTNSQSPPRAYVLTLYDLPGASTTAWTKADLDAAQIGVRLSVSNSVQIAYISTLWMSVDYVPNVNPDAPSSLGGHVAGAYTADSTPTLTFTLADSDSGDTVKYRIQIDDSSDFGSAVVDYTSALATQGSSSFTVGQAAGSGSYTTGSSGQTLSDGSFYWRVKAIDDDAAESSYSTANSGAVAFIVDTTAPSTPGTPTTSSANGDTTPTWSWTTSTDSGSGLASTPYTMQWSQSSDFSSGVSSTTSTTNSFTHSTALSDGTWYFRVKAADSVGNESDYSSAGSTTVDATAPVTIELDSPGDNSYTNNERPTFKWKATTDATIGISKYVLEIDNPSIGSSQPSGDFTIDNIPTSRTTDYETTRYLIHYENFSDSDSTNNYISVYTKTHTEWGASENDGKLREGKINWKVKAVDTASNETTSSRTLFVDHTAPKVEVTQINDIAFSSDNFATTDKTPTLYGKITDYLAGGDSSQTQDENGPKVASGPKQVEIKLEKKEGLIYKLHTIYTINMDKPVYTCDGKEVSDNSKQKCDKYLPFEYTQNDPLELGTYRITLTGKDKADNSAETSFTLDVTTLSQITTAEEEKIIEEELKPLPKTEQEKIKEELEITKPNEPTALENIVEKVVVVGKSLIDSVVDFAEKADSIVAQNTADAVTAIAQATQVLLASIDQGIKNASDAIGRGYSQLVDNSEGLAKTILTGIGNSISGTFSALASVTNTISTLATNTQKIIVQGIYATKEGAAQISFMVGEKTQDISDTLGLAIIKFTYNFVSTPTTISDVKADVLSPTSVKVAWYTNHPANGKVNWGFDDGIYEFELQTDKRTTYHEFILTNLKPDTEYHYEVMNHNKNYVYDANRKFRTPQE